MTAPTGAGVGAGVGAMKGPMVEAGDMLSGSGGGEKGEGKSKK